MTALEEIADLKARFAELPGATPPERRVDGVWVTAPEIDVRAMAEAMAALGFRLTTMTGLAIADGETTIIYHYLRGGLAVNVKTQTRGARMPSIAAIAAPASWTEREMFDYFAVKFDGHPNLIPLMRAEALSEGFFRDDTAPGETP